MRSPGLAKNAEKRGKNAENAAKNAIENAVFLVVFAPRNPYVLSCLAQSGAQSMDGLMERLSAVVQLKNITD